MFKRNGLLIAACFIFTVSLLIQSATGEGIYQTSWIGLAHLLRAMSAFLAVVWVVVTGVVPVFFARRCPDCSTGIWHPVVLEKKEKIVFGGGFTGKGEGLKPIVERTFTCPKCGYRQLFHRVPGDYWGLPGMPKRYFFVAYQDQDRTERLYDDWRESRTRASEFQTYDDWKAFYDYLKSNDREERPPYGPTGKFRP